MLEIDDRYPEYARPYEPIKGRHRHGPLSGNESSLLRMRRLRRLDLARKGFLTGVGVLIVFAFLMPSPKYDFTIPDLKPAIIKQIIPEPDPQPLPTPIPDPEPKPNIRRLRKLLDPLFSFDLEVRESDLISRKQ